MSRARGLVPAMGMDMVEFTLRGEHVELNKLIKLVGLADSGGQGKALVAAGEVRVDGRPETRKTAKIRAGQVVECRGLRIVVREPTGRPDLS